MLIPAMLPLAELVGANGRDLALAYVVGFETECRIARGDRMVHLARTHDLTPERVEMIEIMPRDACRISTILTHAHRWL